jgi:hydrogenase expression/formation protein HypC
MCVAVPAKVIEINGEMATVDFGGGTKKNVNISLVDVAVGKYVLVHAGFAIQVIDEKAAEDTLELMEKIA